jgi:hypothetical protein
MKSELGDAAGKLIYDYDLPTSEVLTLEQWEQAVANANARKIRAALAAAPWIEAALGPAGEIPPGAVEEVPETQIVTHTVTVTEKELGLDTMSVVDVSREREVTEQVPTGNVKRQLKPDWKFEDGKMYGRPTVEDLELDAILGLPKQLPRWIRDRVTQ